MEIFGQTLSTGTLIFLLLALGLALSFEFVNGFHDTANAVATVIYTHSLKPTYAVVWSGCWNLIGVLTSSGAVAFGVLSLLPVELVLNVGSGAGFAMVFALLISAITWNLGTWWLGLPASSSHTLIGAIMGVGLANSWANSRTFGEGVNWAKAGEVGISLLVSPLIGFAGAALLLLVSKALIKRQDLYQSPEPGKAPPLWIRSLLILTCTGVSYSHGSNDGQKGMGLIMLILIGVVPASFALNQSTSADAIHQMTEATQTISFQMDRHAPGIAMAGGQTASGELSQYLKTSGVLTERTWAAIGTKCREVSEELNNRQSLATLTPAQRSQLRSDLYLVSESLGKLNKGHKISDPAELSASAKLKSSLDKVTKFIPVWVKVAVALALGLGTMIGWKRIVVTVGEKIGKDHLTYAQGAAAELVTWATIQGADMIGVPVSTTHILSSGVAGAMAANRSGLQMDTMRNLLMAWVLTLPVCVLLGAGLFSFGLYVVFQVLGMK